VLYLFFTGQAVYLRQCDFLMSELETSLRTAQTYEITEIQRERGANAHEINKAQQRLPPLL